MSIDKNVVHGICFVAGVVAGAAVAYFATEQAAKAKYKAIADEEIESVKKTYQLFRKEGPYATPEGAKKELLSRLDEYQELIREAEYQAPNSEPTKQTPKYNEEADTEWEKRKAADPVYFEASPDDEEDDDDEELELIQDEHAQIRHNVFEDKDETEIVRTPDKPYVITEAEFIANEDDIERVWLTYYEDDDVLASEKGKIVSDVNGVVGRRNLDLFDQTGARQIDLLHVMNERKEVMYEIARESGSYAVSVLGVDPEQLTSPIKKRKLRSDERDD